MKREAQVRIMQPQAMECQEPEAGRGKERFFTEPLEGAWPRQHLDFRLLASITEENQVLLFEDTKLVVIW